MSTLTATLVIFGVIVVILLIHWVAKATTARINRQSNPYDHLVGGVATWLAYNSHLLVHLAECARTTLTDEFIQSIRRNEPWLINATQACNTYLAGGQSFYLICLYDPNLSDACEIEDSTTQIVLKECFCRLLFALYPMQVSNEDAWLDQVRTRFELFLVPLEADLSVLDNCFNFKHTRHLPGPLEIWIAEDMPLKVPLHQPEEV